MDPEATKIETIAETLWFLAQMKKVVIPPVAFSSATREERALYMAQAAEIMAYAAGSGKAMMTLKYTPE